jgi:hypothetical protein
MTTNFHGYVSEEYKRLHYIITNDCNIQVLNKSISTY